MSFTNRMRRQLAPLDRLGPLAARAKSAVLGRVVPYVNTTGARILEITPARVVVHVPNKRRAQNHISGLHACAMALAAETATGLLLGMNVPDGALPLCKGMEIAYLKRCEGGITATATLTIAQQDAIQTTPKGELVVPVSLQDDAGNTPLTVDATWVWIPKKRR